jgi:predicted dehydrogenase
MRDAKARGVAVAGTGFIGPVHVEALRRIGCDIRGILGSTPEKSISAAARLGLRHGYSSFEEILADQSVGIVHIATPNRFHFEMARAALRAGKHVMCEKPLAMNARESLELVKLAEQSRKAAGVTHNVRFYPLCHEARERVRRGDLGTILHVTGSYAQDWLLDPTDYNWRVDAASAGPLRAVSDIGTHWLDLVQFISGDHVSTVCADLMTVHPRRQRPSGGVETFSGRTSHTTAALEDMAINTEDFGCLMLRFAGGSRGCVWVSQVAAGCKNRLSFEIAGSRASMGWNSERPNDLWIGHRNRPNELLIKDPALLTAVARAITSYPGGHNEGFADTFKQCFASFHGWIDADDPGVPPPFPTFADGHRELLLCEAVLKSHLERRWVEISEIEQ